LVCGVFPLPTKGAWFTWRELLVYWYELLGASERVMFCC
jgi:hypothetical protein